MHAILAQLSSQWITTIRDLGILAGLVIFFVWQSWIRENRLGNRLDKTEKYVRDTLNDSVTKSTEAIRNSTAALEGATRAINGMIFVSEECRRKSEK